MVEDMDHSAAFSHPPLPSLNRYVELYNQGVRSRAGDPEIGPRLPGMLRGGGLDDVQLRVVQPVFMEGAAKRIHQITLENGQAPVIDAGLATADEVAGLVATLDSFCRDRETIVSFPRSYQVSARRPAPLS